MTPTVKSRPAPLGGRGDHVSGGWPTRGVGRQALDAGVEARAGIPSPCTWRRLLPGRVEARDHGHAVVRADLARTWRRSGRAARPWWCRGTPARARSCRSRTPGSTSHAAAPDRPFMQVMAAAPTFGSKLAAYVAQRWAMKESLEQVAVASGHGRARRCRGRPLLGAGGGGRRGGRGAGRPGGGHRAPVAEPARHVSRRGAVRRWRWRSPRAARGASHDGPRRDATAPVGDVAVRRGAVAWVGRRGLGRRAGAGGGRGGGRPRRKPLAPPRLP